MQKRRTTVLRESASRAEHAHVKEQLDQWLDDALECTFPASDPIASPPWDAGLAEAGDGPARDQEADTRARGRTDQR